MRERKKREEKQHSAGIHAVTEKTTKDCTDSISNSYPVLKTQFETGKMFLRRQGKEEGSSVCVFVFVCVCVFVCVSV